MTTLVPIGASTFRVRSYEVDARGALTLPSLCDYFQEAADQHASGFGAAVDQVIATYDETWVLYRLAVRLHSPAKWRDEVRIETWPCGRERLYTVREYRALASDGTLLAEGASAWLAMDLSTRRLSREPRTPLDWRSDRERAWPDAFRGRLPGVADDANALDFTVRRGEIDVNGHVNHVHYLSWALEAAPAAQWEREAPVEAHVEYVAEALVGDPVRARSMAQSDGGIACSMSHAVDGRVLAKALTRWAPRG